DLLMRLHKTDPGAGYDARALQVCEQSRARSLLDLLGEARADIHQGVTPELLAQERALTQKLNEQTSRLVQLLNEKAPVEKIKELETSLASVNADLETVKTSIRISNPQYAGLTQLRTLTVPEIQSQVVDADTILVEYQLGEDRSYLWVVTPTRLLSYELPKRSEIEGSVRKVYDWLTAYQKKTNEPVEAYLKRAAQSDTQFWVEAGQLSQVLLGQVAAQLGKKRLLIVADGALHYLPFAALPVPTPDSDSTPSQKKNSKKTRQPAVPFIADHEVVTLPSASMLALLREETSDVTAKKTVIAFADPVFSPTDPRVTSKAGPGASGSDSLQTDPQIGKTSTLTRAFESFDETRISFEGQQIRRLPGSLKEADTLSELTAQSEKHISTGFEATRTAVLENDLTQFRYVHFATHGLLNSGSPELSGLVLTLVNSDGTPQDGFLSLQDIYNLKLDSDCVVLSACQTALGKNMRGEGLVGLTRGFMYAGARRVVASLWSVNDASTVELMREFYGQILQKHQRPAAALRLAQQTLWKQKPNRNPYFWAGFILQGEYR
ncbi:MAG TPA: CHAT domain-containing protein, partial [Acidobacteriota bacterium]|nr:CHAT domain-containing protein [Acidobacteriota bacterium]